MLPAGHWRQRREAAVGRRWRRLHVSGGQRAQQADDGSAGVDDEGEHEAEEDDSASDVERSGDGSISASSTGFQGQQGDHAASLEQLDLGSQQDFAGAAAACDALGTDPEAEAESRAWAEVAVRCLLDCSVVVAMHPDQVGLEVAGRYCR